MKLSLPQLQAYQEPGQRWFKITAPKNLDFRAYLKEVIAQQEVLERVIKERYKKLSENFKKTNTAFERLARESVKEKKRKKKLTKDYNSLWWLAKRLKRQIRRLKQKSLKISSRSEGSRSSHR
jgi:DNA repair exonuclease SbcCD ATPase subunit